MTSKGRITVGSFARLVTLSVGVGGGASVAQAVDGISEGLASGKPPGAVEFNAAFLNGSVVKVEDFRHGNPVRTGIHALVLKVNGRGYGQRDIRFVDESGTGRVVPCFTLKELDEFGVDVDKVMARLDRARTGDSSIAAEGDVEPGDACFSLGAILPDAVVALDSGELELDITVPQESMVQRPVGYVDPALWNAGIDAGMLQYNFNAYTTDRSGGPDFNSAFLGLQFGVNLGQWRFRQRSTLNWQSQAGDARWTNLATYLERDIRPLRSRLTLGDSFTSGEIFDSFSVRGLQLSSDDRMLPDSLRSYAPVVRGVAETNARVIVRQNGNIVYEISVPPGPFELRDLPATGYGGDLQVTVEEADGRLRQFAVPFSAVPQLLRPGISRFNVTTGQYRDTSLIHEPWILQLTYQRGLTNLLSAYVGTLSTEGYASGLLGAAFNTPVGAIALDVTAARAELPDKPMHAGSSWRLTYSKLVPGMNTNVALAAYRYSTQGFYSMRDLVQARFGRTDTMRPDIFRTRHRLQLNINQPIGGLGALFIAGSLQDYWGTGRGRDLQYQAGLTGRAGRVGYTLYAQQSRDQTGTKSTLVGLNLSIALGRASAIDRGPFDTLSTNLTRATNGDTSLQANLTGSSPGEAIVTYGLDVSRNVTGDNRLVSMGGYGNYRSPYGRFSANASIGNTLRQAALNAEGAVIAHKGGITFGPALGGAAALIEAKGAQGGSVINGQGATIDRNGYAVIPMLMPYRVNRVAIDPGDLPEDVEMLNTSEDIVPSHNSLVLVKMQTVRGTPVLATVQDAAGRSVPLGTGIFDASGKSLGDVGQGGMTFLRGLEGSGVLVAKWGETPDERCEMPYSIPSAIPGATDATALVRVTLRCAAPKQQ